MAIIAQEGVALESKLFVGTKHTDVTALDEAALELFIDTATTATTKRVNTPTDLTGLGENSNIVTVAQLGKLTASQFRAQPTPPTLTFSMVALPSDEGQAQLLSAGTTLKGFVVEIVGADGGIRYKGFNGFVDYIENISADGAYTIDVTLAVADSIKSVDDS